MIRCIALWLAVACGSALAQERAPQDLIDLARSLPRPQLFRQPSTRSGLPQLFTPGASSLAGQPALQDQARRLFDAYLTEAKAGDPVAEASVSRFYMLGIGMNRDADQAFSWALKAAEHGNAIGEVYAGVLYRQGSGTPKDFKQAAYWFRKAGETLAPDTAESLRKSLVQGEALVRDKDFMRAYSTLGLACNNSPWSAAAWYNYALVAGELAKQPNFADAYARIAIDSMQMFLALAPEAPQARGAQDLIYEWELKAKK